MVRWRELRQGMDGRWPVVLLVCLLAATSIAQAQHFHNDKHEHHACTVCAAHAPALVRSIALAVPPAAAPRPMFVARVAAQASPDIPSNSIRPPPSV